jgi:hypothetical protein
MKADPTTARLLDQMAEERDDWLKLTRSLTDKLGERDAKIEDLERRLDTMRQSFEAASGDVMKLLAENAKLRQASTIAKDYLESDWFPHKSKGGITRSIARKALS